jgi:hypothetical protein
MQFIVGYVTLSAAQIEREFLPKRHHRNKPDPVLATLLRQLATLPASVVTVSNSCFNADCSA